MRFLPVFIVSLVCDPVFDGQLREWRGFFLRDSDLEYCIHVNSEQGGRVGRFLVN